MPVYQRCIVPILKEFISFFSVVGITGPRQSGKSTLLLNNLPDYTYVTFDDQAVRQQFYDDPERFMRIHDSKVIFDEVQKVPELFDYIKIAVDNDREQRGKYILTGSSQFHLQSAISESLAGRIGLLSLLPFQLSEIPEHLHKDSVFKGAYPELVVKEFALFHEWYASYMQTYIERDVSDLSQIGNLRDFQRLVYLLAADTTQQLNMSRYANDLGVDVKTIKHWISVLEASYVIFLLTPYFKNYGKRMVKRPKVYFYDTGLVSYLTGIKTYEQYSQGPMAGALFENHIVADILKRELHANTHAQLYYLRTSHGAEVDVIVDRKTHKELIEIKSGETFRPKMLKAVTEFIETGDQGYLLYQGIARPYDTNIDVMNYKTYLLN